jgi:myosin heavy chain 6/7
MDSPSKSSSDPLTLLLNEIEILLTQSRLVELYFKQSQATATYERARAREQHQAELTGLRAALAEKEQVLAARQTAASAQEQSLRQQVRILESGLGEVRQRLERREAELQEVESAAANLRQQISQIESVKEQAQDLARQSAAARRELEAEVITLSARLEKDQQNWQKEQFVARELQDALQDQITQLQEQLREKSDWSRSAETELQQARAAIPEMQRRMAELETSRTEALTRAARELEQMRARFNSDLGCLQTLLAERDAALEESRRTANATEQGLKNEIVTLASQFDQKQALVENRDDELRGAQAQITALQQRTTALESAADRLAQASAEEMASLRRAHENELANLRHEVARRDRALTERQEALSAVELALHGKIQSLQQDLARSGATMAEHETAAQSARAEMAALRDQINHHEAAAAENLAEQQRAEEKRRASEAAISNLRDTLAQKESALNEREEYSAALEARLLADNSQLRNELEEQRSAAERMNAELTRLRTEIATLDEQKSQLEHSLNDLEQSRQQETLARQELEARLRDRDNELRGLQANADELIRAALRDHEAHFKSLEEQTTNEITQLQNRLQERELAEQQGQQELLRLHTAIAGLEEQKARSENIREELTQQLGQAAGSRQELEARLQTQAKELETAQRRADEQLEAALHEQESRFRSIEEERGNEITELRNRLQQEKNDAETLREEFDRLRVEHTGIEGEMARWEQLRRELEQNGQQATILRQEIETRLQAKELELKKVQSDSETLKHQLDSKIAQLQLDLAEKQLFVESRMAEINDLKAQLSQLAENMTAREAAVDALTRSQKDTAQLHAEHQAALATLSAEYQTERSHRESELAEERRRVEELNQNISAREQRNGELENVLGQHRRDLEAATSDAATLRSRLDDVESRHTELAAAAREQDELRVKFENELAAARGELQQKAWASAQQQAALENLALDHQSQIQKLESQISEERNRIRERDHEIERSKSQAHLLDQRVAELTAELQQTERTAIDRAVQIKEEYGLRIADLERQLAQKTSELQTRGEEQPELEQTLRRELDRLIRETQEKNQILQDRNDELVRVKAEADGLRERFNQVEAAATEAEAAFTSEGERMRVEFQAQIALLQAELSQKEWADAEHQAESHGIEQTYRQEIESLREKLAQSETRDNLERSDFILGDAPLNQVLEAQFEGAENLHTNNGKDHEISPSRRWQGGFGWKRRWKSS